MIEQVALRLQEMRLPALPAGRRWQFKEFLNNELQAYEPGSRVIFFVEGKIRVLGLPIRFRDHTYPAYVINKDRENSYFEETALLMASQHEEYVTNHNERAL